MWKLHIKQKKKKVEAHFLSNKMLKDKILKKYIIKKKLIKLNLSPHMSRWKISDPIMIQR